MNDSESYRKLCLKQQTALRPLLLDPSLHDEAIEMFLSQHASLHSIPMAQTEPWSFEDDILNDMCEDQIRRIPQCCEHSVAWLIWHIARIEDVAMNLLVAGSPQVLHQDNWFARIKATVSNTGNAMDEKAVVDLSARIDVEELRVYRMAVGRRTREIVKQLQPEQLRQKVEPARLQQVLDEGVVVKEARGIVDYWGRRHIAGLLLMPATRHNLIHLNEALRLKRRRQ